MKEVKRSNVSIFVPHFGCPQKCTFCNQNSITGAMGDVFENAERSIETARHTLGAGSKNSEIAFFGGSFTAIEPCFMERLLSIAYPHVASGEFKGIRISTRPDKINTSVLEVLKSYGVTAIELGAQSMSNTVLRLNRRGHDNESVVRSSELIKSFGFELGLQMMTGMYSSDRETDIFSANKIADLEPDTVRIYPTVVIENTELCNLYRAGEYTPPTLAETVELCSRLLLMFEQRGIRVIRLGLHSGGLSEGYVAGAYHPAMRELCENEIYFLNAVKALEKHHKGTATLYVGVGCTSKMTGQRRKNIAKLKRLGYDCAVRETEKNGKYVVTAGE